MNKTTKDILQDALDFWQLYSFFSRDYSMEEIEEARRELSRNGSLQRPT